MATRFLREQADWNTPQLAGHRLPLPRPRAERADQPRDRLPHRLLQLRRHPVRLLTGQPPFAGRAKGSELGALPHRPQPRLLHHHQPPAPRGGLRRGPEAARQGRLRALPVGARHHARPARVPAAAEQPAAGDFVLASRDVSRALPGAQVFYGPDRPSSPNSRVGSRRAPPGRAIVLISGYTGVGKSSLRHELRRAVLERTATSPAASSTSTAATHPTCAAAGAARARPSASHLSWANASRPRQPSARAASAATSARWCACCPNSASSCPTPARRRPASTASTSRPPASVLAP